MSVVRFSRWRSSSSSSTSASAKGSAREAGENDAQGVAADKAAHPTLAQGAKLKADRRNREMLDKGYDDNETEIIRSMYHRDKQAPHRIEGPGTFFSVPFFERDPRVSQDVP